MSCIFNIWVDNTEVIYLLPYTQLQWNTIYTKAVDSLLQGSSMYTLCMGFFSRTPSMLEHSKTHNKSIWLQEQFRLVYTAWELISPAGTYQGICSFQPWDHSMQWHEGDVGGCIDL